MFYRYSLIGTRIQQKHVMDDAKVSHDSDKKYSYYVDVLNKL